MKHPRRKIVFTLLLTILLIAAFIVILVLHNAFVLRLHAPEEEALKAEAISNAVEELRIIWAETEARIEELYRASADFFAFTGRSTRGETDIQAVDTAALIEENVNYREILLRPEAVCGGYAMLVREDPPRKTAIGLYIKTI